MFIPNMTNSGRSTVSWNLSRISGRSFRRIREVTILDFGCGKSYLTFALYYYLKVLHGLDIRIIGLDLKEDVIEHCDALARDYGYDKLKFLTGRYRLLHGRGPCGYGGDAPRLRYGDRFCTGKGRSLGSEGYFVSALLSA